MEGVWVRVEPADLRTGDRVRQVSEGEWVEGTLGMGGIGHGVVTHYERLQIDEAKG